MSNGMITKLRSSIGVVCMFLVLALLLFNSLLSGNTVLFSTDNNLGQNAAFQYALRSGGFMNWGDSPLVGSGGIMPPSLTFILNEKLPIIFFTNWIHAVYIAGAAIFLGLFLRRNGLGLLAILMMGLVAFCLSTNLTLIYSGHTGKYGVLFFMMLALWCIQKTINNDSLAWAILSGGALGMALLEQQDVALFMGLFWAAYAIHAIVREKGWDWLYLAKRLVPMACMALWIAGSVSLLQLQFQTKDVGVAGGETAEAKWEFATQWSQAPDESIGFIAPGYMGWRSGEPEAPYWGRMGRSAGWEKTGQGFMNFKLDDWYIGAIPIVLALFAVVFVWKGRQVITSITASGVDGQDWRIWRLEVLFWGGAAFLSLLLAFGKYIPLYALIYHFPIISSIRNPVKFLHVFQVAMGILAAYGLEAVIRISQAETRDLK